MSRHGVPRAAFGRARRAAGRVCRAAAGLASCASLALAAPIVLLLAAAPLHAATTPRAPDSDLTIAMTQVGTFATGSNATWTLTVSNISVKKTSGPIFVYDTLPAGFTYTSATGTNWSCSASGQIVTCSWTGGQVTNGQVLNPITLVAAITTSSATSVTNRATVDDTSGDLNRSNDHASLTSPVTKRTVSVTPDGATITQLPSNGTNYSQTFPVANTGNIADTYALTASAAPAGIVTIVSVNGTPGSTSTTTPIVAGGTANVIVVYSVATGAATGATATITLTATSAVTSTSTNSGTLAVTVARAGITMAKALYRDDQATLVGAGAVSTSEFVQYRVTVTSSGGADATAVSVADVIPAQVTYVAATGDALGWGFATAGGTLTATLAGTLVSGTSRYFWIRVQVR
jgi:uncharacterized repeat protein (TIGR01451 family)